MYNHVEDKCLQKRRLKCREKQMLGIFKKGKRERERGKERKREREKKKKKKMKKRKEKQKESWQHPSLGTQLFLRPSCSHAPCCSLFIKMIIGLWEQVNLQFLPKLLPV